MTYRTRAEIEALPAGVFMTQLQDTSSRAGILDEILDESITATLHKLQACAGVGMRKLVLEFGTSSSGVPLQNHVSDQFAVMQRGQWAQWMHKTVLTWADRLRLVTKMGDAVKYWSNSSALMCTVEITW
jgi:hypothetical protein